VACQGTTPVQAHPFFPLTDLNKVLVVCLDLEAVVPYMQHELGDTRLAAHFAIRNNLSGANELFSQRFEELFNARQYPEAALVAAQAPKGVLRTAETLQRQVTLFSEHVTCSLLCVFRFRNCPAPSGQPSPLLQYFGVLLERGHLNRLESIELVRPALQAGRQNLVERWLKEEKLECSEELANEIKGYYPLLALSVYLRVTTSLLTHALGE
jgi:clathrin heavy chain